MRDGALKDTADIATLKPCTLTLVEGIRENGVSASVQKFNYDFILIFLILWFYPCYFETKEPFAPGLDVRYLDAN